MYTTIDNDNVVSDVDDDNKYDNYRIRGRRRRTTLMMTVTPTITTGPSIHQLC